MGASRRSATAALLSLASAAGVLAACDALIGLNTFHVCPDDCGVAVDGGEDVSEAGDSSTVPPPDTGPETSDDASEGGNDAADASDALDSPYEAEADSTAQDTGPDVAPPTVTEIWVHWPMPNPDAAIAPGLDAALPHPMNYMTDDAGGPVVDLVTHLTWEPIAAWASTYVDAEEHCLSRAGAGMRWRVPTRIELVSLIDFTRSPAIDTDVFSLPADAGPPSAIWAYWSSSLKVPDAGPTTIDHWVVYVADGMVGTSSGTWIRCVQGGG
jgi:hypothetical protein